MATPALRGALMPVALGCEIFFCTQQSLPAGPEPGSHLLTKSYSFSPPRIGPMDPRVCRRKELGGNGPVMRSVMGRRKTIHCVHGHQMPLSPLPPAREAAGAH